MAKTKTQKEAMVEEYRKRIQESKAVYFIESQKISANDSIAIKKSLYDLDSSYNVVKNRLFKIALKEEGVSIPAEFEKGQHGIIFATEEKMTDAAKVIKDFLDNKAKEEKIELKIVAGILDGKIISGADVEALASLPSREVMLATLLGTLNAPVSGFVTALAGNIRNLANVLNAVKDTKTA